MEKMYNEMQGITRSKNPAIIIRDGLTEYKIVIPFTAQKAESFAASELSEYIYKSTGARLAVIKDCDGADCKKFFSVGKTEFLKKSGLKVDYDRLNLEGFFIKSQGGNIYLDGANLRGTLYSVYDFLEKFLGVRFLTENSEYVPECRELILDELDIEEIPYFGFRSIQGANTFENRHFAAKLRTSCVWAKTEEEYGGGYIDELYQPLDHSFFDLMPPSKYYKEHPDWYNSVENAFSLESMMFEEMGPGQLCLTNEEMIAEASKNLIGWIKARPQAKYFMIGQMDMNPFCECGKCRESYEKNGGKSGTLIVFINKLAAAAEKWRKENCPERRVIVQTFAYQATLKPPVKTVNGTVVPFNREVVPLENVMIKIAIDKADFFKELCDYKAVNNFESYKSLKEWYALTDRLYMWDYTTNFYGFFVYFANIKVLKSNLLTYKANGIEFILTQSSNQSKEHYQTQLKGYVLGKLLWNPHRDTDTLVSEFNRLHFGADIAPYIKRVTDMFEDYYEKKNFYGILHGGADYLKAVNIDVSLLLEAIGVFCEALKAVGESSRSDADKEKTSDRIRSYLITPQYMLLNNYDEYYPNDTEGKKKLAGEFFSNTDKLGIKFYRESDNPEIEFLKNRFGY